MTSVFVVVDAHTGEERGICVGTAAAGRAYLSLHYAQTHNVWDTVVEFHVDDSKVASAYQQQKFSQHGVIGTATGIPSNNAVLLADLLPSERVATHMPRRQEIEQPRTSLAACPLDANDLRALVALAGQAAVGCKHVAAVATEALADACLSGDAYAALRGGGISMHDVIVAGYRGGKLTGSSPPRPFKEGTAASLGRMTEGTLRLADELEALKCGGHLDRAAGELQAAVRSAAVSLDLAARAVLAGDNETAAHHGHVAASALEGMGATRGGFVDLGDELRETLRDKHGMTLAERERFEALAGTGDGAGNAVEAESDRNARFRDRVADARERGMSWPEPESDNARRTPRSVERTMMSGNWAPVSDHREDRR